MNTPAVPMLERSAGLRSTLLRRLSIVAVTGTLLVGTSGCVTVSSHSSKSGGASQGQAVPAPTGGSAAGPAPTESASPSAGASDSATASDSSSPDSSDSSDTAGADDTGQNVKTGKQGQDVSTSYYDVKINKTSDNVSSKNGFDTPTTGTRYFVVNITMKNKGSDTLSIGDGDGIATLDSGSPIEGTVALDVGNDIGFKDIAPGQSLTGDIVFEVPQGKKATSILFKPISMAHASSEEDVKIDLN